ncbi:MAG: acetate--CoA ligase family protein [Paracoccaceae bacterium]
MNEAISALLSPQTIAIVGASPKEGSFGDRLLGSIRTLGFEGNVALVNPRYDNIGEMPCYASLADVPSPVDCAAFAVGDGHLVASVSEAIAAGVRGAVMFGRAHGSENGRPRTGIIREMAQDAGMAICGANCMGFVNLTSKLQMTGLPFDSLPAPSGVALISHSGSTWSAMVGNARRVGFDIAISAGQELATSVADYIRFLIEKTDIRVITCVLETIRDPAGFITAAELASAKDVPIVMLKLGRSEAAKNFAISHSGALSGSNAAYDAVFEQHGIIRVTNLDELLDTVELLTLPRTMPASGVALGTDSGGERQLISDVAADVGLSFSPLSSATIEAVETYLDPEMEATNPLDYWGDGANVIAPVLIEMSKDPAVGIVVMATNMLPGRSFAEMSAEAIRDVHKTTDKPVAVMGNVSTAMSPAIAADLRSRGIAVLMGTVSGLSALAHVQRYRFHRPVTDRVATEPLSAASREILAASAQDILRSASGFRLLEEAGIPVTPFADVTSVADMTDFATRHGWPLVLKIDDPGIPHKSDHGGVYIGLKDASEAEAAWQDLRQRHPDAPVIVQAMADGAEVILGMTTDPDFGPLITLGLGGVFAEILRDTTALMPPVSPAMARRALEKLKLFPLLTGARGRASVDLDALCRLISRFSAFAAEAGEHILELEINPVIAGPNGATAVDCLTLRRNRS